MNQLPIVSVCMITYNHENFIEEAINGVMMQECDFEIELILANDCSPDKTDEVIKNILSTHPRAFRINYIKHQQNIGMMPNFIFAVQQCKGKYIALCDGDDYWIDPLKLQKQVDFLELNKEYVACFHNANVISDIDIVRQYCCINENKKIDAKDIILNGGGIYPTASLLFKNTIQLPDFVTTTRAGDSALAFSLLKFGNFHYLNQNMCVYRKHAGGVYTSIQNDKSKILTDIKSNIELLTNFRKFHNPDFNDFFKEAIQKQLQRISNTFGFYEVIKTSFFRPFIWNDLSLFIFFKLKNGRII